MDTNLDTLFICPKCKKCVKYDKEATVAKVLCTRASGTIVRV